MRVVDLMTRDVITVTREMPVLEALKLMQEHDFRRVPVVDEDGRHAVLREYPVARAAEVARVAHRHERGDGDERVFGAVQAAGEVLAGFFEAQGEVLVEFEAHTPGLELDRRQVKRMRGEPNTKVMEAVYTRKK